MEEGGIVLRTTHGRHSAAGRQNPVCGRNLEIQSSYQSPFLLSLYFYPLPFSLYLSSLLTCSLCPPFSPLSLFFFPPYLSPPLSLLLGREGERGGEERMTSPPLFLILLTVQKGVFLRPSWKFFDHLHPQYCKEKKTSEIRK